MYVDNILTQEANAFEMKYYVNMEKKRQIKTNEWAKMELGYYCVGWFPSSSGKIIVLSKNPASAYTLLNPTLVVNKHKVK